MTEPIVQKLCQCKTCNKIMPASNFHRDAQGYYARVCKQCKKDKYKLKQKRSTMTKKQILGDLREDLLEKYGFEEGETLEKYEAFVNEYNAKKEAL